MSRFDYVAYDKTSQRDQAEAKEAVQEVERVIEMIFPHASRAKSLALTKLEEVYMWIGKGIRDQQLQTNAVNKLMEQRTNS